MTDKVPPETVAQAWADWAQDFGESPGNPPIGSWRALRECFLGGMFMAIQMMGHHRGAYEYAMQLDKEIRDLNSDEVMPINEWVKVEPDDEPGMFSEWLLAEARKEDGMRAVWDLLDRDENGNRELPELGFAPELAIAINALEGIIDSNRMPRPENTLGEPRYSLATDMRTLAMVTLSHIRQMAGEGGH